MIILYNFRLINNAENYKYLLPFAMEILFSEQLKYFTQTINSRSKQFLSPVFILVIQTNK